MHLGENPIERILSDYNICDFSLSERLLTQCRIIIFLFQPIDIFTSLKVKLYS